MSTRGFESWTEADVERLKAQRSPLVTSKITAVETPSPKGHKYRAEPCIVTPDLTLYRNQDIERLEQIVNPVRGNTMKKRAERFGIVGIWFGSLKEGRRWIELLRLEVGPGSVRYLRRQVPYELHVNGARLGCWKCDFLYDEIVDGAWKSVTEDSKGRALPLDKWKRAHVEAEYSITIRIT